MGIVRTEVGATFGIRTEVGMDRSGLVPKWVYPWGSVQATPAGQGGARPPDGFYGAF